MKFFRYDDDFDDEPETIEASMERWERYNRHLASLESVLPADALGLARLEGVDDGVVIEVHHLVSLKTLILIMRCGHLQMGYYDLVLTYERFSMTRDDELKLARIARATKTAWRCDDVDVQEIDRVDDGRIEHRLLFHSGIWFAIRCETIRWEKIARPDREIPFLKDRFPGGAAWARKRRLYMDAYHRGRCRGVR